MMKDWVSDILAHYNLGEEFSDQQVLILWERLVGEQLARMTRTVRFSAGTLTVEVASAAVSQELNLLKQRYIDLLNEEMGRQVVERIRFIPGRFPRARRASSEDIEDSSEEEISLPEIEDEHLRSSFADLYRTQRRREHAMLKAGARRCPRCGVVFFGEGEICPGCQFDEIADKE